MTRTAAYLECTKCRERWMWARLPMAVDHVSHILRHARCPNCGAMDKLSVCQTQGEDAVTEPREGKVTG